MKIARRLEDEKILTPTAYLLASGRKTRNKISERSEYAWETSSIEHVLENRQYTGCTVNFKSSIISYKVHKKVLNSEDDWQIIPNTQEAIIDEDTFNRVQELKQNRRRNTATGRESLFSSLLYCADCKSKLYFCDAKSVKENQEFHRCSAYKENRELALSTLFEKSFYEKWYKSLYGALQYLFSNTRRHSSICIPKSII